MEYYKVEPKLVNKKTKTSLGLVRGKLLWGSVILPSRETKKIKEFISTEKVFYGRIDTAGDIVTPLPRFLAPVGAPKNQIFAQGFVADAFSAMKDRAEAALRSGQIRLQGNSAIFPLEAKKGYADPDLAYGRYINNRLSPDFIGRILGSEKKRQEIHDFDTFLPIFREYLKSVAASNPVTRSGYVASRLNTPLSSGLMIEIANLPYNDDQTKSDMFYRSRHFEFYRDIAYFHGFVLDKNIPWRLVADVNSPNMSKYIARRRIILPSGDAARSVFYGYDKVYETDLNFLARMSVSIYNTFAASFPFSQINKCSVPEIVRRQPVAVDTITSMLKYDHFWIRTYVEVRNLETDLGYDGKTLDKIVKTANDLRRNLDTSRWMSYINSKFNSVEQFGGSLFHDITRSRMARNPESTATDVDSVVKRSVQLANLRGRFPF